MKNWQKALIAGGAAFGLVYFLRKGTTARRARQLIADPIYFAHDSFIVDSEGQERLREFVGLLPRLAGQIRVTGHCDSDGSEAYNMELGLRRAQAVGSYLMSLGVPEDRMVFESAGESEPTGRGKAADRRVEITMV